MLYIIGFYCAVVGPLTASPTASANDDGANWINQAVWLSLAGSATVFALMNPSRFLAAPIMRSHVFLIALTGWFTLSAVWSLSPEATIRRVASRLLLWSPSKDSMTPAHGAAGPGRSPDGRAAGTDRPTAALS